MTEEQDKRFWDLHNRKKRGEFLQPEDYAWYMDCLRYRRSALKGRTHKHLVSKYVHEPTGARVLHGFNTKPR